MMRCGMGGGGVVVDGSLVRGSTPDWGGPMARGESVRVRCVAATRMVSVVRRGREYELAALPATWDMKRLRFGVRVSSSNTMRLTGASAAAGASCARARVCVVRVARAHRGVCVRALRVCARATAARCLDLGSVLIPTSFTRVTPPPLARVGCRFGIMCGDV